jgi:hypothetical protein
MKHFSRPIPVATLLIAFAVIAHTGFSRSDTQLDSKQRDGAEFAKVVYEIDKGVNGKPFDPGSDEYEMRVDRLCLIFSRRAAAHLSANGRAKNIGASIEELKNYLNPKALRVQDPGTGDYKDLSAEAIELPGTPKPIYVDTVKWYWTGTFFVLAPGSDGRYAMRWDIRDYARRSSKNRDEVERWLYATSHGFHDGPFIGKAYVLPNAANGHPRFLMDAITLSAMGNNRLAQISVWEWTGTDRTRIIF